MTNPCRQILKNNGYILGGWMQIAHPVCAEVMAHAGFDFITVDIEHGIADIETTGNIFRAIETAGRNVIPMVRLAGNEYSVTKRYIDAGAKGIIIPLVNSGEDAREAVRAAKYPPEGDRGVGFCRANLYGSQFEQYIKTANDDILVVVQIEHIKAMDHIDDILTTRGVDGVFIGPYDLSASMGIPGELDHPDMQACMIRIRERCKKHNVAAGIHVVQPDVREIEKRIAEGYKIIACSLDTVMLAHICKTILQVKR